MCPTLYGQLLWQIERLWILGICLVGMILTGVELILLFILEQLGLLNRIEAVITARANRR